MTAGSNPIFDYDGEDELEGLAPREQVISDEELPDFEVPDFDVQDEELDESLPDEEATSSKAKPLRRMGRPMPLKRKMTGASSSTKRRLRSPIKRTVASALSP